MKIINLTQHCATEAQVKDGVFEPQNKKEVQDLLTFLSPPIAEEINLRAKQLSKIAVAHKVQTAMIGGAPYLMGALEVSLLLAGITPVYSFSQRRSIEKVLPDGKTEKTAVFEHTGFVVGSKTHYDGVF
jgi:hypothetical protein